MPFLARSCGFVMLGLTLLACAPTQDDDVESSSAELQKLPDLGDDDGAGDVHVAGDCPHMATYLARVAPSGVQVGCAGCHNPNNQRAPLSALKTSGSPGCGLGCHDIGHDSVAPSFTKLNGDLSLKCASAQCHGTN